MIKYKPGLYRITTKNGDMVAIELNSHEARALIKKLMWLKILNIKEVEHEQEYKI